MSVQNFLTKTQHEDDMELINRQCLKELTSDDVFTFSVVLCDNEIDRYFEVFSEQSLKSLEKLFVGRTSERLVVAKTGLLGYGSHHESQSARIYKTQFISDPEIKTSYGDTYKCLKAWCYMIKNPENAMLIKNIEDGVKKAVSISCSITDRVCSICGKSVCNHRAGKLYDDKLCYKILTDATDAYEWAF